MRPKIVSQLLNSIPLSELLAACMTFRQVMGITTELSTTLSFIRMNRAARLSGSISTSAWRQSWSKVGLRQRDRFRPVQLLSRERRSHEELGHEELRIETREARVGLQISQEADVRVLIVHVR